MRKHTTRRTRPRRSRSRWVRLSAASMLIGFGAVLCATPGAAQVAPEPSGTTQRPAPQPWPTQQRPDGTTQPTQQPTQAPTGWPSKSQSQQPTVPGTEPTPPVQIPPDGQVPPGGQWPTDGQTQPGQPGQFPPGTDPLQPSVPTEPADPFAAQQGAGGIPGDSSAEAISSGQNSVISTGRLDLAPRVLDGNWTFLTRQAAGAEPPVWRNPRDVVVHLLDDTRIARPSSPDYDFLDVPAGQQLYTVSQVPGSPGPRIGISTQDLQAGSLMGRGANLTMTGVSGPGYMVAFAQDTLWGKPRVLWDTRRPDQQPAWFDVNTSVYPNWVFSAPGIYRIGLRWSAKTTAGANLVADATLRFAVGTTTSPTEAASLEDLRADAVSSAGGAAAAPQDEPTPWPYVWSGVVLMLLVAAGCFAVLQDRFRGYRLRKVAERLTMPRRTPAAAGASGGDLPSVTATTPQPASAAAASGRRT